MKWRDVKKFLVDHGLRDDTDLAGFTIETLPLNYICYGPGEKPPEPGIQVRFVVNDSELKKV